MALLLARTRTLAAQDIEVKHLLEKFVPVGDALERPAPVRPVLDKDGRSYTTGSRKTARAQCWLVKGDGHVYVNGVKLNEYFAERTDAEAVIRPFEAVDQLAQYNVWAIVQGGGPSGQASAIGVAVARGVAVHDPATEPVLKELGLTKIDTRQVERKKTGQPKARKKNAWVKR
ncbi:ribosomal protein S9/S16-domain-containing protein [Entophlyctis helioformis]|nr:ribosomal protein S9/S16-domain-containing protein [Entophlyctis helioformis]